MEIQKKDILRCKMKGHVLGDEGSVFHMEWMQFTVRWQTLLFQKVLLSTEIPNKSETEAFYKS